MKNSILFILLLFVSLSLQAQTKPGTLYHPEADAHKEIEANLAEAKAAGKNVILQIGGNWCGWCYRFHDFVEQDATLKAIVAENFVVYHLNYSKENGNKDLLAKYRFPQRFGFPVFVVLDAEGNQLHTQDSALLESGKSYDAKKVANFFKAWTVQALNPESYKD